jgi:hypothetical protein
MGDVPFFSYSTKRSYRNAKKPSHTLDIQAFINQLNPRNSSTPQIIATIWHNSKPHKMGTLIWLTLNRGLPIGT